MQMNQKLVYFIEKNNNACFVTDLKTNEIVYSNKESREMFGIDLGECDYKSVFGKNIEQIKKIEITITDDMQTVMCYNKEVFKITGEKIFVDFKISYFNEEKTEMFVEIIKQSDTRMQIALHQVNQSFRPKAILNYDDKLSIIHCNDSFHKVFESNEELRHSHFKNDLVNGFLPEVREELLNSILKGLENQSSFSTKMKVFTAKGEERWYLFELEKRTLDNSGADKILAYMTNIEKQVELEEEYSKTTQFFQATQELSEDIIYKIEVDTMTLYHSIKNDNVNILGKEVPDYINSLINKEIVHPDDAQRYLNDVTKWFNDEMEENQEEDLAYRFRLTDDNEYRWYISKSKKIFDENGKAIEVYGKLINVDKQKQLQEDYSLAQKYFIALEELTQEILFHIDIKTKVFRHADENAIKYGMPVETPDFANVFIKRKFIHPEDVDIYKDYTERILNGENLETQVRFSVKKEIYEWFHIKCKFIYDEKGRPVEIFGTMENIQDKKELEVKATHDLMTNVLNKVSFENEVQKVLDKTSEQQHALIFVDLDNFKGVNDTLGHRFGDLLLTTVGKRIKRIVRESDIVGRVGGDEFVVFMQNIDSKKSVQEKAELLLENLRNEFSFEGKSRKIKASLGISIYPVHGKNYKDLIHKSDIALYSSKSKGKDSATIYEESLGE